MQAFAGGQSTQTAVFHLPDGATLAWYASPASQYVGTFRITSYTDEGWYDDLIANIGVSMPQHGTYTFQGDTDIFLDIMAQNTTFTITISALQ